MREEISDREASHGKFNSLCKDIVDDYFSVLRQSVFSH